MIPFLQFILLFLYLANIMLCNLNRNLYNQNILTLLTQISIIEIYKLLWITPVYQICI